MSKSDQGVIITTGLLILLHLSILTLGYFTAKVAWLAAVMNLAAAVSIILYRAIRQLQIEQHTIEFREIIILLVEVLVMSAAVFYIVTNQRGNWLKVMQYIFLGFIYWRYYCASFLC